MANANKFLSFLGKYFGVIAKKETYFHMLYLSLVFPLGIFYFVYLVTGFSVSAGILILIVSIPIIAFFLLSWWGLIYFERIQARYLLNVQLAPITYTETKFLNRCWEWFKNPVNWKGLLFLLIKFPFGIATFVVGVVFSSIVAVMVTAPFLYDYEEIYEFGFLGIEIDTMGESLVLMFFGLILLFAVLHLFNGIAFVWKKLSELLLNHIKTPVVAA